MSFIALLYICYIASSWLGLSSVFQILHGLQFRVTLKAGLLHLLTLITLLHGPWICDGVQTTVQTSVGTESCQITRIGSWRLNIVVSKAGEVRDIVGAVQVVAVLFIFSLVQVFSVACIPIVFDSFLYARGDFLICGWFSLCYQRALLGITSTR